MRWMAVVATLLLCGLAQARECVIRVAYPDRPRPGYYIGEGPTVPDPPGAGVDLIRAAVKQVGCTAQFVRLPSARLKFALIDGSIDMAPVELRDGQQPYSALPLTAGGKPDTGRGMRLTTVVYVRAADSLPAGTNPREYFKHHKLAAIHGAPLGPQLRDEGYTIDNGAPDISSNMDKLMLGRVDGVAFALANVTDLDALVAARYGIGVVRLDLPMRVSTAWLSASHAYHRAHPEQMEQLWNWVNENAVRQLKEFLKNYPASR